jgi:hypothetical protein
VNGPFVGKLSRGTLYQSSLFIVSIYINLSVIN